MKSIATARPSATSSPGRCLPAAPATRILARLGALLLAAAGAAVMCTPAPAQTPYALDVTPPELVGGPALNTPDGAPIRLAARRGKVTVVHFWTFGCINCKHNLPAYQRWQKRFEKRGVEIIGIHTPETEEEKIPGNVAQRVKALGITYPVLLDQNGENWKRWQQRYWPTVYLVDRRGRVRYAWEGELGWKGAGGEEKMARRIEMLLREGEKQ